VSGGWREETCAAEGVDDFRENDSLKMVEKEIFDEQILLLPNPRLRMALLYTIIR
jgi:hypothetical protein